MTSNRSLPPIILAAFVLLGGCREAPAPVPSEAAAPARAASADAGAAWSATVEHFIEGYFERHPTFAAEAGKHEFDGRLPDYSPEAMAENARWLHAQRDTIAAMPATGFDRQRGFQRDYLLAVIDGRLFMLEESGFAHDNPVFYVGDLSPSMYLTRPYAPLAQRMAAFVRYEEALPKAIEQIRANMRPPLPASYIELGINTFAGLSTFFAADVPGIFADVADAELQARFKTANAQAVKATREMADWYATQQATATQDFALGAEKFRRMLQATERVETPLDRLEQIGQADLSRNLISLKSACHAFAADLTLGACVAKAGQDKPEGGAVEGARRQLDRLRRFIVDEDLVSIPGNEQALVEQAPPFNRWNFAYIEIPGPYEKNLPSVYYIAPPDPSWPQAEQDAYVPGRAALLFTSAHEVWPGHFLQFLHANRADWTFGRLFVGYAFAEGWAHYTEEMMFDAGVEGGGAEIHIGQLSNALLRDVRFLSAIGMHTGGMTMAESERMFREQAFQDPGNARQQAARGTYDPGYLNYTMGKLMIMQLREDWLATHGGREQWKAFHDAFLSFGGPPIPLVRAQMLGGAAEAVFWQAPALGPPAD